MSKPKIGTDLYIVDNRRFIINTHVRVVGSPRKRIEVKKVDIHNNTIGPRHIWPWPTKDLSIKQIH